MAQESVRPLSIMKSNSYTSPSKGRPLSEINPMGIRRNSPSYNPLGKKSSASTESSPFEASPGATNSPRLFWKIKEEATPSRFDTENIQRDASPALKKRSSIENLKKASHVKNSNMFAKEHEHDYDPDNSSLVDRPLANGRPLSVQLQGNAWGGSGLDGLRNQTGSFRGHRRTESSTDVPLYDPSKTAYASPKSQSPSKLNSSPIKSSISTRQGAFSPEGGLSSEDETSGPGTGANTPRPHLRQPKSVTFDAAPPTINEYEMITPDPSSVASGSREGSYDSDIYDMDDSLERDGSYEREDSFDESLEDTDKTPVVLPEDWRFMSPDTANTDLADTFEDPFKRPISSPSMAELNNEEEEDSEISQSGSVNSNGERRPLPPLPDPQNASSGGQRRTQSPEGKHSFGSPKPSPPRPASISKDDILKMSHNEMPLADRLHLLSVQNNDSEVKRRESMNNNENSRNVSSKDAASQQGNEASKFQPHITRDVIKSTVVTKNLEEVAYDDSCPVVNPAHNPPKLDYANLDPDVPIPSRETSSNYEGQEIASKQSDEDKLHIVDMYTRRQQMNDGVHEEGEEDEDEFAFDSSVIHHEIPDYDDYDEEISEISEEGTTTVQSMLGDSQRYPLDNEAKVLKDERNGSLAKLKSSFDEGEYTFGPNSLVTPSTGTDKELPETPRETAKLEDTKRPASPSDQGSPRKSLTDHILENREVSTPDSVVHHPIEYEDEYESSEEESPAVPEPVATIKTHGSRLKTRPSATPADITAMAAARRIVSGELPPSNENNNLGRSDTTSSQSSFKRRESFKMKLDIPMETAELGFGIDREFDRLLEAQKKGYMMREQEEVVVASTRNFSGDNPPGVKTEKPQTEGNQQPEPGPGSSQKANTPAWTTEPWNGRMRRHSTRKSVISPERKINLSAAPPLPGQESNVDAVAEDDYSMLMDDPDDVRERGRLFVKVVKVKDLDLPLPRNEQSHFQLTLDNGLHCVTTAWLELGKTAPIGQEFELVVFDDLEFQLTLQTNLERPTSQASSIDSMDKATKLPKSGGMGKFFMGAKKRRELEKKQQEEAARAKFLRQQELDAQRANHEPTAWDLQHDLVGPDGSFARAYVSLSNHEQQAFGRPCTIDVPCFNEWSVDDKGISTRSKLGSVQRRPPYRIARMELQLLYVPRPRDAQDEDLPKSMSAAGRQLKEAEASASRFFEGHLSQQGGDCPYWRRRYFKLNGSELKAYHEHTRQPRAKISLTKAIKLIDDRSTLTKPELPEPEPTSKSPAKKGGRRKSAFAQDEEGYMFVEEGFRIRFANGEVIDFYADNAKEKQAWMSVLSEAIGKDTTSEKQTWMQLVLARERLLASKVAKEASLQESPCKSAPTSPQKSSKAASAIPKPTFTTPVAAEAAKEKPLPNEPAVEKEMPKSSPSKLKQPSAVSPTKSQTSASSPSKRNSVATPVQAQAKSDTRATGRRLAVKSMIF